MLPAGNAGKKYIKVVVTRFLNAWTQDTQQDLENNTRDAYVIIAKNQVKFQTLGTIWIPSKDDYNYEKEVKSNLHY